MRVKSVREANRWSNRKLRRARRMYFALTYDAMTDVPLEIRDTWMMHIARGMVHRGLYAMPGAGVRNMGSLRSIRQGILSGWIRVAKRRYPSKYNTCWQDHYKWLDDHHWFMRNGTTNVHKLKVA